MTTMATVIYLMIGAATAGIGFGLTPNDEKVKIWEPALFFLVAFLWPFVLAFLIGSTAAEFLRGRLKKREH
jgi:uncharacterized membrane protein YcaP (DUF421 family)